MKVQSINNNHNPSHKAYFKPNTTLNRMADQIKLLPNELIDRFNALPNHEIEFFSLDIIDRRRKEFIDVEVFNHNTKKRTCHSFSSSYHGNLLENIMIKLCENKSFFNIDEELLNKYNKLTKKMPIIKI